ncbi:hypothetical protein [Thermolongibacillus altinsuensis]|uniref:hypothetical protein n=1 Tax=Thermolongibacillus altinsuensis TaxID=575256 RepID=UPI002553FFCF|nr:hypothetical protein [Thermolongibacillus altinsuensis]
MPIPNVKRIADKFICLMAFSFGGVAEKLVHVGKLSLSYYRKETGILNRLFINRNRFIYKQTTLMYTTFVVKS